MKNNILKEFIKYSFLNVLGMMGVSFYILADTFFIARGVGEAGLAALNIAVPVYSFIYGTGLLIGMGGATRFSILKSRNNDEGADRIFTASAAMSVIASLIFMAAGLLFSENIARLLGANEEIFDMTNTYLKIMLIFSPAFIANELFICYVRNDKNPSLAMLGMLSGSLFNIIFDYILIFPCKLGITGAVLATVFSPVVGITVMSFHKIKKKNTFHLCDRADFMKNFPRIISLGFPSLISELSSGIVIIVFNMVILGLKGNTGVAAYAVVANIYLVAVSVFGGISHGVQPLLSRAYGCENYSELKQTEKYSVITVIAAALAIYSAVFLFSENIVSAFNSEHNENLQKIAEAGMKMYFSALPFVGLNMLVSMIFTSVERPAPAQTITILRGIALIIPVAFFMSYFFRMTGVWLSLLVTEGIVFIISAVLYKKFRV